VVELYADRVAALQARLEAARENALAVTVLDVGPRGVAPAHLHTASRSQRSLREAVRLSPRLACGPRPSPLPAQGLLATVPHSCGREAVQ
jgi:hypothetical protein